MLSFLSKHYVFIFTLFEILAAFLGVFYYKKFKSKAARLFIWFLIYAVIVERLGGYPIYIEKYDSLNWLKQLIKGTAFESNYFYYDVFWYMASTFILSIFFRMIINQNKLKKVINFAIYFFLISSIYYFIIQFSNSYYNHFKFLSIISLIIIIISTFSYFIYLINSDKLLVFYKELGFYVAVGSLPFWLITTPMQFFEVYFHSFDAHYVLLKKMIFLFSIIFMYLTFSIGLIVSKPEQKK